MKSSLSKYKAVLVNVETVIKAPVKLKCWQIFTAAKSFNFICKGKKVENVFD